MNKARLVLEAERKSHNEALEALAEHIRKRYHYLLGQIVFDPEKGSVAKLHTISSIGDHTDEIVVFAELYYQKADVAGWKDETSLRPVSLELLDRLIPLTPDLKYEKPTV